jgi:hypothetical protein
MQPPQWGKRALSLANALKTCTGCPKDYLPKELAGAKIGRQVIPDAHLVETTDAAMRLSRACICGSNLWPYKLLEPLAAGQRMGREDRGANRVPHFGTATSGANFRRRARRTNPRSSKLRSWLQEALVAQ